MKHRARGFALFTALILLGVLALVGVLALRASGLELDMSTNQVLHIESFESSDSPRLLTIPALEAHIFSRGWPRTVDSDSEITDGEFDYDPLISWIKAGWYTVEPDKGGRPRQWYLGNEECGGAASCVLQQDALQTDARYERSVTLSGQDSSNPIRVHSDMAVFKVRTDLAPGAGAAMVAGYEGTGKAAAASGGNIFFLISSRGLDNTPTAGKSEAATRTSAMYRHVIRN